MRVTSNPSIVHTAVVVEVRVTGSPELAVAVAVNGVWSIVLLPGFVNCHCHTASTVFRSQTDDGAGGRALYSIAFRARAGSRTRTGVGSRCSARWR